MAAPPISGPGLLYVNSKVAQPDILTEETFMKWYNEDHIPEIIATSGINSALRWKNINVNASKPNLVLYPMRDVAFLQGQEFKNIKVHSDILPGGGPIYDLADFDTRYYELVQVHDPLGLREGQTKLIVVGAFELSETVTEEDFNDYCNNEHFEALSRVPGYLRSTRHKLLYFRSNAQSRQLKCLPPRPGDKEEPAPPAYLSIHEFDRELKDLDMGALMATGDTEWSKKIIGSMQRAESSMFSSIENYGDAKLFHGE